MPTGLIPLLSNKEVTKALENRWGLTVNTGWLVVKNVGDPQQYDIQFPPPLEPLSV